MTQPQADEPKPSSDQSSLSRTALLAFDDLPEDIVELVSAVVDGEPTAEERAIVERDPRLMLHVKHLQQVRELLRTTDEITIGPADPIRSIHIAGALDAWTTTVRVERASEAHERRATVEAEGAEGAPTPPASAGDVTRSLPSARRLARIQARSTARRAALLRVARAAVGVAAAGVLVAGIVATVVTRKDRSDETATAGRTELADANSQRGGMSASSTAAGQSTSSIDLGPFDQVDRLLEVSTAVVQATIRQPATFASTTIQAAATSPSTTTQRASATTAVEAKSTDQATSSAPACASPPVATAQLAGKPVTVVLAPGGGRVQILDATTCALVAERSLPSS